MDNIIYEYTINRNIQAVAASFWEYFRRPPWQLKRKEETPGNVCYSLSIVALQGEFMWGDFRFFALDNNKTGVILEPVLRPEYKGQDKLSFMEIEQFRQWMDQFGGDEDATAQKDKSIPGQQATLEPRTIGRPKGSIEPATQGVIDLISEGINRDKVEEAWKKKKIEDGRYPSDPDGAFNKTWSRAKKKAETKKT